MSGSPPPRSLRKGTAAPIPTIPAGSAVSIYESTHELTYVASIENIETGPISATETVKAWVLDNGKVKAKAILMGGNLVSITDQAGQEYVWLNQAGATNYGAKSNAFPLTRGLILHGGIRVAAVTAEHGLYFDTDWDISFQANADGSSATMVLSIQDTAANRELLNDPMSSGQYSPSDPSAPMSLYPITDGWWTLRITLNANEDFVRLEAEVENTRTVNISGEIWLPQTYPVTRGSQVISKQIKRRVKDQWVQDVLTHKYVNHPQGVDSSRAYPAYAGKTGFILDFSKGERFRDDHDLQLPIGLRYPLSWPSGAGGILYDYPFRDGLYHAVSYGDGRGAAYVSTSTAINPHYTKQWSWGDPAFFNREEALKQQPPLAAGRPKTDYYEPWGSAFNTGFFELTQFTPGKHAWQAFIVPIAEGLETHKTHNELVEVVDARIAPFVDQLEA